MSRPYSDTQYATISMLSILYQHLHHVIFPTILQYPPPFRYHKLILIYCQKKKVSDLILFCENLVDLHEATLNLHAHA